VFSYDWSYNLNQILISLLGKLGLGALAVHLGLVVCASSVLGPKISPIAKRIASEKKRRRFLLSKH
jgi:hypothetical protein